MKKYYFNDMANSYVLTRSEEDKNNDENLITIADIKKGIEAIKTLYNDAKVTVYITGGCIDVMPVNKDSEKLDPYIFRENKVTKINNSTLNVLIGNEEYKTKKLNDSYKYENKIYYTNILERVIFKIN